MSFEWRCRRLETAGDYVAAMRELRTDAEARAFRQACDADERNLGYLTGYMTTEEGDRVRALLGIEHPMIGDLERPLTPYDLFELGAGFVVAQSEGLDFDDAAAAARKRVRELRRIHG